LARLVENTGEGFIRQLAPEDIEGRLHLWAGQGTRQGRPERFGRFGIAAQGLRKSPDETGVPNTRLNLDASQA
jgi:hypothetical protein